MVPTCQPVRKVALANHAFGHSLPSMIRKLIHRAFSTAGLRVSRLDRFGVDPWRDIHSYLHGINGPTVFDVGANEGQTIGRCRGCLPSSRIHAFEPGPNAFGRLRQRFPDSSAAVTLHNVALGSSPGVLRFQENANPFMSSFLPPGERTLGTVIREIDVAVTTIDAVCTETGIDQVHLLKTDTQGFDLEVFQGASELMESDGIGMILTEVVLSDMYEGIPRVDHVFGHLMDRGFLLVGVYEPHFQQARLAWCDALFVNRKFHQERLKTMDAQLQDAWEHT